MINNFKWIWVISSILFLTCSCSSTYNQKKSTIGIENKMSRQEIDFTQAINIAKQYIINNNLASVYKLKSAAIYKRLTDQGSIAISFRSGFFDFKHPFVYVIKVNRQTGEIEFAGEMK